MIVVGYVRVSTHEQAASGLGLDAQRAAITLAATARGWQVVWIEDAGYSAKSLRRPGVTRALRMLAKGEAQAIVVAKLDRLSRSVQDFAATMDTARRQGWALVALDLGVDTTTPAGELVANVMAAVAQWERRVIGQRTADALAAKKAQGVRLGGPITTPPPCASGSSRLPAAATATRPSPEHSTPTACPPPAAAPGTAAACAGCWPATPSTWRPPKPVRPYPHRRRPPHERVHREGPHGRLGGALPR